MNMLPKNPALRLSQKRKQKLQATFINALRDFCNETNLHGWKFVVSKKSTTLERSIWALILTTAIISVSALLNIAYREFMKDPTIIFTESTHNMVWNYEFPAVTVCNHNQMSKSAVLKFIKTLKTNVSQNTLLRDMKILSQMISIPNQSIPKANLERLQEILQENKIEIDVLLEKLAPKCEKIIKRCKWKGEEKKCMSLFESEKTFDGFCCSFNYYATKKNNDTNYKRLRKELRTPPTPRRISACGFRTGLEILIQNEPEDYFATQIPSFGHMLLIHSTHNYPQFVSGSFVLGMGTLNFFSVQPTVSYATESVRKLAINERNCAFSDEIQLHNFEKYSHQNCLAECRMNITKELCGCLPFYYVNAYGTYPKTKVCDLKDLYCLQNISDLLLSSKPGFSYNRQNQEKLRFECNCYKDCETNTYNIQLSASSVSRKYSKNNFDFYGEAETRNSTIIRIFYTDLVGNKNRNDVKYDLDDLIAFYGGLLSLFLGFSGISLCEIIYFLIIRTLINTLKKSKKNKIKVESLTRTF